MELKRYEINLPCNKDFGYEYNISLEKDECDCGDT